jgi:uncharacterized membrane protein
MNKRATITVHRSREEVERLWHEHRPAGDAPVTFRDAPGDRGTEIHVEVAGGGPGGRVGELAEKVEVVEKVVGAAPRAKVKDQLRRFKQLVETGEIPRSDGSPEGERFERKLKQRPAQPLSERELQEVGG